MNSSTLYALTLSSALLALTACSDKPATSIPSSTSSTSSITTFATDAWLGKWNGPEGTFLEISGGNGNYEITIQDLDGPKQYRGTGKDNKIYFERNGASEIIEASSGADTGMKWLAEKSNCLRTRLGEGWCRD